MKTGKLSRGWRFYLNLVNIDREDLRQALSQEVTVDGLFLDQKLNSLLGEFLLFEVGQVIQPPSGGARIQALRSTLVLSALRDNRFSVLELLQNYPTQEIQVNGLRLARLGRTVSRLRARGLTGIASSVEDWLVQVQSSAAESVCDCQQALTATAPLMDAPIPTLATPAVAQFLPANWQPVASHREDRSIVKVVWLTGTPYEMGFQHGQLLHDEIASIGQRVINVARFAARGFALGRLASKRTYPDLLEECRGLVDATQDLGIDMDVCMVMAYADVYQEILGYTLPQELFWEGCNQMVATGSATVDGRLYHGSSVDNGTPVDYVMNHPVIFVRQPNTGLPHIFVTYPGVVWPNSGMNVAGITLGLDTAHPNSPDELSLAGRSNVQIMAKILQTATSFEEARTLMETQPRVRANIIMIADGKSKQAGVFEFTGKSLGVRTMPDSGVLYATNHFELPDMYEKQALPPEPSSLSRFDRFKQLLEPDQAGSYYGRINPEVVASIERDRVNPYTQAASPLDVFDDNASPGGNGSLRQAIFDPDRLQVWIAAGQAPVPENPFVCFAVGELLGLPNATPCVSPEM
ncbi:MAG: alpha/beta hydrolase [Cyanobacteria bacterium RM1_2_2]|nr:alpha/beta hydrolase [Cyanobacteria bacterium RM1_2_2]